MNWGTGNLVLSADPTGGVLNNNYVGTTTTVMWISGGTFDFTSVDLGDVYNNSFSDQGGDVLFTFTTGSGSTTQTVTIDGLAGFQTFTFNQTGLLSFSYLPQSTYGPWVQADNFVLDGAVVPEPASWAMLIAGFGLTGAAMRRRRAVFAA